MSTDKAIKQKIHSYLLANTQVVPDESVSIATKPRFTKEELERFANELTWLLGEKS